jgi:hypothetical protein
LTPAHVPEDEFHLALPQIVEADDGIPPGGTFEKGDPVIEEFREPFCRLSGMDHLPGIKGGDGRLFGILVEDMEEDQTGDDPDGQSEKSV